jgi:GNAT superfamily N-acetyltransferase
MIIRDARKTDAQQIATVHAASWRFAYQAALSDTFLAKDIDTERSSFWANRLCRSPSNQYVIVAEKESNIIGFACAYANYDDRWGNLLDNLHIIQSMQHYGIGTKLLVNIAQWCHRATISDGLFLWVLQSNLETQRFYQALGAVNTGSDIWVPPGGGRVPRYRYAWQSVSVLLDKAGNKPLQPNGCAAS